MEAVKFFMTQSFTKSTPKLALKGVFEGDKEQLVKLNSH